MIILWIELPGGRLIPVNDYLTTKLRKTVKSYNDIFKL